MPPFTSRRQFLKVSAYAGGGAILGAAGLNGLSPMIWRRSLRLEPNDSFWANSQLPSSQALSKDLRVDVAVVGGGFTGLSSAYFIRRASPHKSVALLEGGICGSGASGRNGAMVLTSTADRYMKFSSDPGMDKRIYDLTVENIRFLASVSAMTGIDSELEIHGALQGLISETESSAARSYVRQARLLGMPVEYWEPPRIRQSIGTEAYLGALFDPNCGQIHPMKLVNALKVAATRAGVMLFENTPVQNIEEGQEHLLHTSDGRTVRAKSLVLATNAFTPALGYLRNSILPLREYVAITEPFSDAELEQLGLRSRIPINDSRTAVFYLGVTQDRRIHIGGGSPLYAYNNASSDAGATQFHTAQLQRELGRLYPRLAGVSFSTVWSGVIDWSLDASPSVGSTGRHKNVFYGLGYSGHGVNLTSLFGRIIADLEAGQGESWTPYPFVNNRLYYIPNEPFRWMAAQSGLAWYKLVES